MPLVWFSIIAVMLAVYVVLDGFDIGAGIIHLGVARTDAERRQVIRSIGPVWDGNEVWLLAAGGTIFLAFPALYAASFSGFYLPLMIVLWLLILRGISIEFRSHIDSRVWKPFWDVVFCGSSALLAIFFGAALGNVVRGVPLDKEGFFFLPLWTHFGVDGDLGVLDWYTVLIGLLAYLTLTMHGALWVALKTDQQVAARSRRVAAVAWWGVLGLTIAATAASFAVQPQIALNLGAQSWGYIFPALALAGLLGVKLLAAKSDLTAFLASCTYITGMLTSAAFGVFPYVLPSRPPGPGMTIHNAAAPAYGLEVGIVWWIFGALLAAGYFIFTYRHFAGRIPLETD